MKFYCGIDLSARDCHVCVINEQLKVVIQQKLRNELPKICQLLAPYKANLKIVVESTFNWYWLIDGLQAAGFEVVLAHTLGLYLITGAKVKTDRRDAYSPGQAVAGGCGARCLHLSRGDAAGARPAAPAPASGSGACR